MPYIPGSPIHAYCASCKADTDHLVIEVEGNQVRKVRCERCGGDSSFKAPRSRTRAALLEYAERRSSAPPPRRSSRSRKAASPEEIFRELARIHDISTPTPYDGRAPLKVGEAIEHPTFGVGIVTQLNGPQKAIVCFESGEKVMACNRG